MRYGSHGGLRVTLTGPNAGTWKDFDGGMAGGIVALIIHAGAAGTRSGAVDWLRRHGIEPPDAGNGPQRPRMPPNGRAPRRNPPGGQPNAANGPHGSRAAAPAGRPDRTLALLTGSTPIPALERHPARRWLARRALWRADADLPPWLRWLEADALAAVAGIVPPGPGMAGAIVAPAAPLAAWMSAAVDADWPRQAVTGCQLVNVAPDGRSAVDAGWLGKRSYDGLRGGVTVCGVIERAHGVTLAEGVADALALAARFRPASIAALGTGGLIDPATVKALAALPGGVTVYPDPDRAGHAAADALQPAIERHGGRLRRADLPPGMDAADLAALEGFPDVDTADLAAYRRIFEADGRPAWECGRLAYVTADGANEHLLGGSRCLNLPNRAA